MKKKIFLWVPIFMMAVVSMTVVSCSDDDNIDPKTQNPTDDPQKPDNSSVSISPEYVPITWEETEIYASNSEEGTYSFESTEETRKIEPGSVLAIDEGTSGEIVIVTEVVNKDGDRVTVKTEKGGLCDVFYNCDFTLSSDATEALTRYASGAVITPEKVFVDGVDITAQLTKGSKDDEPITKNLWNWDVNYDDTELYSKGNAKITLEEANFSASLDLVINFSFGDREPVVAALNAYRQYRSKALWVNASLAGSMTSNVGIKAEVSGEKTIESGEEEPWIKDVFKPVKMKFWIQGIPVYVTISADLFRGASLEMEGNIALSTATHNEAGGGLGFEWRQTGGISPIQGMMMKNELVYPTVSGKGSITGTVWLYPRVYVSIYGVIGPSFDIKPYLGCSLTGGFSEQMLSSSDDYCAWQLRTFAGLDVSAGIDLDIFGIDDKDKHTDIGTLNVAEADLYKSPTKIEFLSSTNEKVQRGVKNTLRFKVYDTKILGEEEIPTPLPQFVKFEAPGTLSSKYGIARNGIVSVDWTPASNGDKLSAILYDDEGKVISKAEWGEIGSSLCPDAKHPHAIDLGLPSGTKWSCMNLGARLPEDYGLFYAWGETHGYTSKGEVEGESDYSAYEMTDRLFNWNAYKWSVDSYYTLTKYCTKKGYGTVDGKTQLDIEDDAAHQSWGDKWRMPTEDEMQELRKYTDINWTADQVNDVWGFKFTSKTDKNTCIFIPAAGYRDEEYIRYPGERARYWTSTLNEESPDGAITMLFDFNYVFWSLPNYASWPRSAGLSIRPVYNE